MAQKLLVWFGSTGVKAQKIQENKRNNISILFYRVAAAQLDDVTGKQEEPSIL